MAKLDVPPVRDLYDAFIADYTERTGQKTPLLRSAFIRILAWPFAGLTVLCYRFGQWVYFQMFLETCAFNALLLYGFRVGIDYKDGSSCVATVQLTGITGAVTSITAGTLFVTEVGNTYQSTNSAPVTGGTANVVVSALSTGEAYNLNIGDQVDLASPILGVPGTGYVTTVTTEGEEPETADEYRARVQARYRLAPQGGAPADYFIWGTGVDGIVDIFTYVVKPGITTIYPVSSGSGSSREPSPTDLTNVELALRQSPDSTVWDRHPVQAELNVLAPTFEEYTIAIAGLDVSANTIENRSAIKAALVEYLDTRKPQLPSMSYTAAGATVSEADATNKVMGVLNASVAPGTFGDLTISPSTDGRDVLTVGELANLASLTINGVFVT